jgi:putative FmdB family regulatory protein
VPTYEYRCDNCGKNFDFVQSFDDAPLTECPTCGMPVKKVFGSVGIVFKGSGFYKTDSRPGASSTSKPKEPTPAETSKSDGGSSAEPAASPTATPASGSSSSSSDTSSPSTSGSGTKPSAPTP